MIRGQGAARFVALALTLGLSGCLQVLPQLMAPTVVPGKDFHKAAFSISGAQLFVRSDDTSPWQRVYITLDTEGGYYHRRAGDMEPGQVLQLPLAGFVDRSGKAFGPGIRLKSVWVQAHYPDGEPVNELAFPAETFGYRSPVPPGG